MKAGRGAKPKGTRDSNNGVSPAQGLALPSRDVPGCRQLSPTLRLLQGPCYAESSGALCSPFVTAASPEEGKFKDKVRKRQGRVTTVFFQHGHGRELLARARGYGGMPGTPAGVGSCR